MDSTKEGIKSLIEDYIKLSDEGVSTASSTPPPFKKHKTARITGRQDWVAETHPLYDELVSLLGGMDQRLFLWHDTAQKWFKPWDPFREQTEYDDVIAKKPAAETDK